MEHANPVLYFFIASTFEFALQGTFKNFCLNAELSTTF